MLTQSEYPKCPRGSEQNLEEGDTNNFLNDKMSISKAQLSISSKNNNLTRSLYFQKPLKLATLQFALNQFNIGLKSILAPVVLTMDHLST